MADLINKIWTDFKGRAARARFGRIDNAHIALGDRNDVVTIQSLGLNGSEIDGGAGRDILNLTGIRQSDVEFSKDPIENPGNSWVLSVVSPPFGAVTLTNVETLNFAFGIVAALSKDGITVRGTEDSDVLRLSTYTSKPMTILGGRGNDVIHISPRAANKSNDPVHQINGGEGNDTLYLHGLPSAYPIERQGNGWLIGDLVGHDYFRMFNVERATFDDGSKISFRSAGDIQFVAGSAAVQFQGTAGNDSVTGSAFNDSFHSSAGKDFYDFSKGGDDRLWLDSSVYAAGTTTRIDVKGFKDLSDGLVIDGRDVTLTGPNLSVNEAGFLVGQYTVNWDSKTSTVLCFQR